jgi:hypothetical protein
MVLSSQVDTPRQVGPVFMIDGDKAIEMKYSVASKRGSVSGVGVFSKSKEYFVFDGPSASQRTKNREVAFEFSVASDLNPQSTIYLIKLETKPDRREVRTGIKGARSAKQGVPQDRRVPTRFRQLSSEGATARYRLEPTLPLSPGEYCLVRSSESCFDFGVDK